MDLLQEQPHPIQENQYPARKRQTVNELVTMIGKIAGDSGGEGDGTLGLGEGSTMRSDGRSWWHDDDKEEKGGGGRLEGL